MKNLSFLSCWGTGEQQNEITAQLFPPVLPVDVDVQRFGQRDASNTREFRELSSFSGFRRLLKSCIYNKLFCLWGFVVTSKISSVEGTKAQCLSWNSQPPQGP